MSDCQFRGHLLEKNPGSLFDVPRFQCSHKPFPQLQTAALMLPMAHQPGCSIWCSIPRYGIFALELPDGVCGPLFRPGLQLACRVPIPRLNHYQTQALPSHPEKHIAFLTAESSCKSLLGAADTFLQGQCCQALQKGLWQHGSAYKGVGKPSGLHMSSYNSCTQLSPHCPLKAGLLRWPTRSQGGSPSSFPERSFKP